MHRVLALTKDTKLINNLANDLSLSDKLELSSYSVPLNLIEKYVSLHSELVILDIDLIGEQVIHLIKVLRSIKKGVQFILILSMENMAICSKAISLGVISYILKPCSTKNLSNLIVSTLNKSKVHN